MPSEQHARQTTLDDYGTVGARSRAERGVSDTSALGAPRSGMADRRGASAESRDAEASAQVSAGLTGRIEDKDAVSDASADGQGEPSASSSSGARVGRTVVVVCVLCIVSWEVRVLGCTKPTRTTVAKNYRNYPHKI